jgi:hypothetical protein
MAQIETRDTTRYGSRHGELKFGHVHNDECLSAAMIRSGHEYRQYITLDAVGQRKGCITACTPNTFQIKCAHDLEKGNIAFVIEAQHGDIIFNALDGDIRMQARNIDILAKQNANNNKQGVLTLEANEKIMMRSKNVEINGSSVIKFFSSGNCEVVAKCSMDFSAGLFSMVDNACANKTKPSLWKDFNKFEQREKQQTGIMNGSQTRPASVEQTSQTSNG